MALVEGAAPLPLTLATVSVAGVLALVYLLLRQGASWLRQPAAGAWLNVLLVGALGSGAVVLLGVLAMTTTSATNRGLFQAMYPVATAIAARLMLDERLAAASYALIAAMTGGLLLMFWRDGGLALGLSFFLLLGTLPLIGLADVWAKRTLADADAGFVTVGRLLAGALVLSLTLPLIGADQWAGLGASAGWVALAGAAMAAGLLGLYRAMDVAGASRAAAFAAMAPVVTAVLEWSLLGLSLGAPQLVGIALVVTGAVILAYRLE